MKPIRLSRHAEEQCRDRGATEAEVLQAVHHGAKEPARHGRILYRANFQYDGVWKGRRYTLKQVAAVVVEEPEEIVVVTVYTFFFSASNG